MVGLLSLINNSHPKDALIAGAKCLVLVINRELFEKLLHEFPDFNKNLKSKLVSDLNKKVSNIARSFETINQVTWLSWNVAEMGTWSEGSVKIASYLKILCSI